VRLLEVGQVPDDGRSTPVQEVGDGREPVAVARVDDDLVPVVEQRLGSRPSETVRRAGDEDACQISGGERAAGDWLCRLRRTPLVGQHQHHLGAAVGRLVDVDIAEFGGRTAVPLIVICQCAVVRRVVAP
jgi:hypothetical protein